MCRLLFSLVVLLVLSGLQVARAQPSPEPCEDVLAEAEQRYLEQDYDSVEPYVIECVYRPGVTERQLQEAYRLLALAYIRQDLLADAQLTIVKLFGVDYAYEPDPVNDPPFYVALVSAVKDQLRVEASSAAAAGVEPVASGGEAIREVDPEAEPTRAAQVSETSSEAVYEPVAVSPSDAASEPPASEPPASAASEAMPVSATVDINTASADELETLSGIGPALAGRIISYRTDYGPFARPEDLQNVRGIGPSTMASLLPQITAGDGTPPTPSADSVEADADGVEADAASGRIDLNTASAAELDALRGIGPALAQRIVESREQEGPFRSVDEVTRVRGIGPAKLEGFRDQVTVGG